MILKSNSTLEANNLSEKLSRWVIDRKTCIIVFAVLTLSSVISTLAESALFVSICTCSSTNLHNHMLRSIMSTTMYFFNKNTSGSNHVNIMFFWMVNYLIYAYFRTDSQSFFKRYWCYWRTYTLHIVGCCTCNTHLI